jgi:hypothetical protein
MLEIASDKDKLWALQHLIKAAEVKSREIVEANDQRSVARMADLVAVIDDAATKLSNLRWVDRDSLGWGVLIYSRVIGQL